MSDASAKPPQPKQPSQDSSQTPIQIEPLTKDEQKERGSSINPEDDPEYPEDWKSRAKTITDAVNAGFKYHTKMMSGRRYMVLRKGRKDKGLGVWSEEREAKLFGFYPQVQLPGGAVDSPAPSDNIAGANPTGRTFLSVPISRVAIVPRDYVPTISVIRYFQIMRENGYPGDFSAFINETVIKHFVKCHNIKLKVLIDDVEE